MASATATQIQIPSQATTGKEGRKRHQHDHLAQSSPGELEFQHLQIDAVVD
jgi:hypothetical protein